MVGQGRVPLLPRVEGTGLGPGHGYRAVDPGHTETQGSRCKVCNTEHKTQIRCSQKSTWTSGHRVTGQSNTQWWPG